MAPIGEACAGTVSNLRQVPSGSAFGDCAFYK